MSSGISSALRSVGFQLHSECGHPTAEEPRDGRVAAGHPAPHFLNAESLKVVQFQGPALILRQPEKGLGQSPDLLVTHDPFTRRCRSRLQPTFQPRGGFLEGFLQGKPPALAATFELPYRVGQLMSQDRAQPGTTLGVRRAAELVPVLVRLQQGLLDRSDGSSSPFKCGSSWSRARSNR